MKAKRGTWLSLVTFCAVRALAMALGFGILFAGASVAFAGSQSSPVSDEKPKPAAALASEPMSHARQIDENGTASSRRFAGMITDSHCGARHPMDSGKTTAECVRACVRNGSRYVLVNGEKIYALEGDPAQFEKLAGERVEVEGMLNGDTIRVQSVIAR